MHHHSNKKRQVALRSFTYGVMTAAVVTASLVSILIVLGYQFNRSSGKVEQGSLLQFRSIPSDARVSVDGEMKNFTTPNKTTIAAGDHTVMMSRDGYSDWSKSVRLKPGELMWLNYTRLVPSTVSTEVIKEFAALNSVLSSPNKRWVALQQTPATKTFDIYNIADEKNPELESLTIPEGILPEKITSAEITEWDNSNKYFLVVYNKSTAPEYVRIDRTDPEKTVNITKTLNVKIDAAHFRDGSGNVFFIQTQGDIRKINIDSETISQPRVSNVTNFEMYKPSNNSVVFSAVNDGKRTVGIYKDGAEKPKIIRELKDVQPQVRVTSGSYFGDDYIALSNGAEIEIVKNPNDSKEVFGNFVLRAPVQWLQFSTNGRFIVAQQGNELASHDLEYDKTHHLTLAARQAPSKPVGWLDGYHVWDTYNGTVTMTEFDGVNKQAITDALPGYDATLSANGKQLFSIGQNKVTKKPVFQSSRMIIEE